MFHLYLSYQYLYWRRPNASTPPDPLPEGIERLYVKTRGGDIELLCASKAAPGEEKGLATPPVVFVHGGTGSAWVWIPYMRFLAARGIASYAVSMRGHGESWHPSFPRMVYGVTKRDLADDVVAAIKKVQEREAGSEVVLVGHSSGGGLSQFILGEGDIAVRGLALLGAVPGTGSFHVYTNWWRLDPSFTIRMLFHGWHPNSPLSHPLLTKRAFFSDDYPEDQLVDFQSHTARYESFWWPIGMMYPFADPTGVLRKITGWGSGNGASRVLIMAGTGDKLMTRDVQEKSADTYRTAFSGLVKDRRIEARDDTVVSPDESDGQGDTQGHGVMLAWVPGAGHHLQNDTMWEVGAEKLLTFLQQL